MKYFKFMFVLFLFASFLCFNPNQGVAGFPSLDKALKTIKEKKKEIEAVILDQPESKVEVKTTKDNFDKYATIRVEFSGLSQSKNYHITVVEEGTPDTERGFPKNIKGKTSGKDGFSGLGAGRYEVRIYPEGSSQITARYPFTVGSPPSKTVSGDIKTEEATKSEQSTTAQSESKIKVKTTKDNFESRETISVEFSGLSQDKKYGSAIVEAGAPDTEKGSAGLKVLSGRPNGRTGFSMQSAGYYEVRIYPEGSSQVIARYPFTVGNPPPKTVSQSAKSTGQKPKGIARTYFKSLEKQMQKLDELSQNANWNDPSFQNDFSQWLHGMNRDLKNVQSTDPDFDTSEYTAKYADYKSLLDKKSAELEAESKPREDFIIYVKTSYYELKKLFEIGNVTNYYDKAMAIDYANVLKKVNEGVERFPDREAASRRAERHSGDLNVSKESVKEIRGFGTKYETFYNETIHNLINEMIENAYSMKDSNANEAVKYAEEAKMLSDAALSLLPGNSKVADLNKDADATLNNVGGEIFAKIYTSDFHKKNAGKIVFFSSTPKIKSEDESTVKEAYKAGDFVYAMVYLKGSLKDLTKARNKIKIQIGIHVDGNEKASHGFVMDWETVKKNKSYLFMEIIPDPATNEHSGPIKYVKALSQISPRKHEIKVVLKAITGSYLQSLAEGQFSLDCSSGQDKLKEYAAQYSNKSLANYTMPKPKMKDKALVESMISALKNEGWEKGKKVQRVVITRDAWEIFRHAITGVILYRKIPAAAAFKTDDGECKYWNLSFKQGYDGKSYGKTVVGGVGSIVKLSCDNILK
jgi:hypothetical protein